MFYQGDIMATNPISSGSNLMLPLQQTNQSQQDKLALHYKQAQQARQFQQVQQAQKVLDAQKQEQALKALQTQQAPNTNADKTIGANIDIHA
jgi:hypothetical protein